MDDLVAEESGMLMPYVLLAMQAFTDHLPLPPSSRVAEFVQINEILCENPRYAMDYAAALSHGNTSELAKDVVGREANREVCGRFIGLAVPEQTSIVTSGGVVYQVVAFRFKEDHRIGWLAQSSFAPRPDKHEVPL